MKPLALLALLLLAACESELDTTDLPSADNYTDWYSLSVSGPIAGHGDTFRTVYVNDVARSYPHGGRYQDGSVLVKEIHDYNGGRAGGALRYVAIMRLVGTAPAPGVADPAGWIFSKADSAGGAEEEYSTCWQTCHRQAPYGGVFYDYGE